MSLQILLIGLLKGHCKSQVTFPPKQDWAGVGPQWHTETVTRHTVLVIRTWAECIRFKPLALLNDQ